VDHSSLAPKVEVANKEMSSKLEEALKRTEATEQALVDKTASLDAFITTRRSALFEAVPTFIDQQLSNEQPLDPAFRDPMQFARTDEIDHLTFYSASFRFRPPETDDEREIYLKALIATCRHQIIKGSPGAALNRLELFFKFEKATDKSAHASRMRAQAYSLRARAYYSLLDLRIKFKPVTPDAELKSDLQGYRREIEKNLRLAKEADFLWALSHQYQALYLSLAPVDEDIPISDRPAVQLENQRLAIEIYQMLLDRHADFTPNSCNTARRNIGCCHKRIGDSTGDYSGQFAVLRSFPKESEIAKNAAIYHPATHPDAFSRYFWHEMISDGVLFESLGKPEKLAEYQGEWVALLSEKMDISAPRQAYENLFEKFPEYRNWAVKPWTLL
jgi:hypothetical protein